MASLKRERGGREGRREEREEESERRERRKRRETRRRREREKEREGQKDISESLFLVTFALSLSVSVYESALITNSSPIRHNMGNTSLTSRKMYIVLQVFRSLKCEIFYIRGVGE